MPKIITCLFIFLISIFSYNLKAETQIKIVAIVDNEVITSLDLANRLNVFSISSNLQVTPANKKALEQQIREMIIIEKIKTLAAEESGISLSEAEIESAFNDIAKANNMSAQEFLVFINERKLSYDSIYNSITSELLWQRLIISKLSPAINVNEAEVAEAVRILQNKQEFEVKYDFLDFRFNDQETRKLALGLSDKIYTQIVAGEVNFSDVSNDKIASASMAKDWVIASNLKQNIAEVLGKIKIGEVSKPFTVDNAIIMLKLIDKRELSVNLDEDIEAKLRQDIFIAKLENKVSSYLRDLQSSYYIERKNF